LVIILLVFFTFGCSQEDVAELEVLNTKQEMLNATMFTAQAVSELTAHFSKLLDKKNRAGASADNFAGTFSRLFSNKASAFINDQKNNRTQSAGRTVSDLEAY
jgi:hypothetical protein